MYGAEEDVTVRWTEDAEEARGSGDERAGVEADVVQLRRTASRYERVVKPLFDRVVALVLIIVLLPVLAVVALCVRLQLGPGVIYRQYRIGWHGTPFPMFKFRTMDADRRREADGATRSDRRTGRERRQEQVARVMLEQRRERERRQLDVGRRQTHKSPDDPRHTRLAGSFAPRAFTSCPNS